MPETGQVVGAIVGAGIAVIAFLAREFWRERINGRYMTAAGCKTCRELCRAELAKELEAGDQSFQGIRRDISTMKYAMVGVVLALIPICETVTEGRADCSKLREIAQTLAQ